MSARRYARLRREYLYKKSQATQDATNETYEKKQRLKRAIEGGKPIPTELKKETGLRHQLELDDVRTENKEADDAIDDEYSSLGVLDPKMFLTTSRNPSSRLKQFVKEMKLIFPGAQLINRGGLKAPELVETAKEYEMTDIVIVHETRGEPDGLIVSHLPLGPTAYFSLANVMLRHDLPRMPPMSEAAPHLLFNNFSTKLGLRMKNVLKALFPVPKAESRRVMTFANRDDIISFRHHNFKKVGGQEVELAEVGPRFEMKLYQLKLGTLDMKHAENEWVLRPYMNTAKRRKVLG